MPQKFRSRLGFLSGYASRRIAAGSWWRRSMGARMRRTITELSAEERTCFATLFSFRGFLARSGHRQVNPAALAVAPFIQTRNDFFHGPRDISDISTLVATNCIFPLLDDVAVPACTYHVSGRICRLHGYDLIVFFIHGIYALLRLGQAGQCVDRLSPSWILVLINPPFQSRSENGGYGRDWPLSSISGCRQTVTIRVVTARSYDFGRNSWQTSAGQSGYCAEIACGCRKLAYTPPSL